MNEKLKVELPLDWNLSKNKAKVPIIVQGKPSIKISNDHLNAINDVRLIVRAHMNAEGWKPQKKTKTWLFITVYKKDHTGDAINTTDGLADAVKREIGIDDCWFSSLVDWQICPKNQQKILLEIMQVDSNTMIQVTFTQKGDNNEL